MATAIPQSMTFEMLSRLPANSFVLDWKEVRPDTLPAGGRYQIQGQGPQSSSNVSFHIRGAPNEFILNTNCYLSGTSYGVMQQQLPANIQATAAATLLNLGFQSGDLAEFKSALDRGGLSLCAPHNYFNGSRESFNSGSLPFLDNQDNVRSQVHNLARSLSSARNENIKSGKINDFSAGLSGNLNRLVGNRSGHQTFSDSNSGFPMRAQIVTNVSDAGGGNQTITYRTISLGKNRNFSIPLGLYSNLINSHSVLPVGLMSSYSVNGYNVTLSLNTQNGDEGQILRYSNNNLICVSGSTAEHKAQANFSVTGFYLQDLRIYLPYIKVLDPAVMEAVLSLYEKREVANIGGVSFPMSLRLNSLGYRFSSFSLGNNGQSDFYFRIAGTDRSVRAIKWIIYDRTQDSPYGLIGTNTGVASTSAYDGTSERRSVKVVRLETHIGSEEVHPVVEDLSINTSNIDNFVSINDRKSGHLFSCIPYYRESSRMSGYICDDILPYSNVNNVFSVAQQTGDNDAGYKWRNSFLEKALSWGTISLENLDRREGDHSGSYQASGKDLTNVGGIEMRMRIGYFASLASKTTANIANGGAVPALVWNDGAEASSWSFNGPDNGNFEIVFMYAYDAVHEISPQGVMDITNAIL